jgi:hypothetical protein
MQKRRFDARSTANSDWLILWRGLLINEKAGTNQLPARPGRAAVADHSHTCTRPGGEYKYSPNFHLFFFNGLRYLKNLSDFAF